MWFCTPPKLGPLGGGASRADVGQPSRSFPIPKVQLLGCIQTGLSDLMHFVCSFVLGFSGTNAAIPQVSFAGQRSRSALWVLLLGLQSTALNLYDKLQKSCSYFDWKMSTVTAKKKKQASWGDPLEGVTPECIPADHSLEEGPNVASATPIVEECQVDDWSTYFMSSRETIS